MRKKALVGNDYMSKFFVDKKNISHSKVFITGDDIKHITKVLRKGLGDNLTISDGQGYDYDVKISEIYKDKIEADIIKVEAKEKLKVEITLYQALPKLDKMETIIQKCTELGITKIVPFVSEHIVVVIDDKKSDKKVERWRRVALEACKQCGRSIIPIVSEIYSFNQMLDKLGDYDLTIFAYEKETTGIKGILKNNLSSKKISVIVGPEGGFSEVEARKINAHGAKAVGLGPRILRTETAGMAVLCIIMYEVGDMTE